MTSNIINKFSYDLVLFSKKHWWPRFHFIKGIWEILKGNSQNQRAPLNIFLRAGFKMGGQMVVLGDLYRGSYLPENIHRSIKFTSPLKKELKCSPTSSKPWFWVVFRMSRSLLAPKLVRKWISASGEYPRVTTSYHMDSSAPWLVHTSWNQRAKVF